MRTLPLLLLLLTAGPAGALDAASSGGGPQDLLSRVRRCRKTACAFKEIDALAIDYQNHPDPKAAGDLAAIYREFIATGLKSARKRMAALEAAVGPLEKGSPTKEQVAAIGKDEYQAYDGWRQLYQSAARASALGSITDAQYTKRLDDDINPLAERVAAVRDRLNVIRERLGLPLRRDYSQP